MQNNSNTKDVEKYSKLYNKYYKVLLIIPVVILIISLVYLFYFYSKTGDIMLKDSSLTGGTSITLNGDFSNLNLESQLKSRFSDISTRKLTDIRSGKIIAITIESSANPDELKKELENILGYELDEENSSIEFTGPALSNSFYRQLIFALIVAFILMSLVVFYLFKTFTPSIAVIFAAFSDIVMPLALINFLGIKLSAAGISAFLMLIGYSVDTDILLTSRVLKKHEGSVNNRIFGALKTGFLMNITALAAVLPAMFIITGLPDSFRQIFLILSLGLIADVVNTWFTNASIIKWYTLRRKIE
jgi:preprotein translocase subunit SecF